MTNNELPITTKAALDSGCTSHLMPESQIPDGMEVDNTARSVVNTAKAGQSMTSLGRISAGKLENTLIMPDNDLKQTLVSVSALDRSGHTVIFYNGKTEVIDSNGKLVAMGRLNSSNLYEIDVQNLISNT